MDISDFVVNKGNGIKGLVDKGFENLPEKYIQPLEERFDVTKALFEVSIPVIDVSSLGHDPNVAESICDAASKWGFFQIINHEVPINVLDDLKESTHRFFELPNEERGKYLKGNSNVLLGTSFSPRNEDVLEWKDYLSFRFAPGGIDEASPLWPPVCKEQVVNYMKKMEFLIKDILQVLLKKLNVMEIDQEKENLLMGSLIVNLNYYPVCPNPELTAGVGPHSDISTITVLLQDEVGGLFVREPEGDNWIHVPPIKGAIVINIGDALQIISNNKYKSIEHRVVANRNKTRVSISIFVAPKFNVVIGPLRELVENGEKPLYKNINFQDYFGHFFSKGHDGKKTIDYVKVL